MPVERDAQGRFLISGENPEDFDGNTDKFGSPVDEVVDSTAPVNRRTIFIVTPITNEANDFYKRKAKEWQNRQHSVAMMNA